MHPTRHTFTSEEALDLGPGPRPGTSADWESRARDAVRPILRQRFPAGLAEFERVALRVDAADGPDISVLDVDLTGVQVQMEKPGTSSARRTISAEATETGTVRQVRARAMPLHVENVPVTFRLEAHNLPILWARDDRQHLWVCGDEGGDLDQVSGEAELRAPVAELTEQVRRRANAELADAGFTLAAFDLVLTSSGHRVLDVVAHAKVRKGIMSASLDVTARVEIDQQMVLTVSEVQASSRNPLIALPLAILRSRIDAVTGRRVDLNDSMPSGLRLVDVRLRADRDLYLWARLD